LEEGTRPGDEGGKRAGHWPATGFFSAVFMRHLRASLRWLKLLGDVATEHLQGLLAILLGEDLPPPMQS